MKIVLLLLLVRLTGSEDIQQLSHSIVRVNYVVTYSATYTYESIRRKGILSSLPRLFDRLPNLFYRSPQFSPLRDYPPF